MSRRGPALLAALVACGAARPAFAVEETETATGRATERESLDVHRLSKQPTLRRSATPVYPAAALAQGTAAEVTLLVDLDEQGEVTGATVAEVDPSAAALGFEQAALEAAYGLAFEPAEVDGKPVPVQVTYRFKFKPPAPPANEGPDGGADALPAAIDGGGGAPDLATRPPGLALRGRLLERGTRAPLGGVTVLIYQEDADGGAPTNAREATSTAEGAFALDDVPAGRWNVFIDNSGYVPFETLEELRPGELLTATYYLERLSSNPYDVVVTSVRPRKEVSRTVLDQQVIEKLPGAAGDPLTVVQNLAGVARVGLGSGEVIVRGSAPRDTRIFAGGMEIPTAYHFGGLRSVLPLALVESIEFYPGNFSPYYGRATGGVLDLSLKRLRPARVGGYVDLNLYDGGAFLEIPVGERAVLAFGARRSYVDALVAAFFPEDSSIGFATAPRYHDYQLAAQYRPRPGHDLRFMFFGSDDDVAILFKQPADYDPQAGGNEFGLSTAFYRSLFSYAYTPSPWFSNTVRFSQGRDWLAFGIGVLSFRVSSYTSQLRDTARFRLGERVALSVGADFLFQRGAGTIALPPRTKEGQPPGNTDYAAIKRERFSGLDWYSPAAFAELEVRPWPSLLVVPGFRADYFSRIDEWTLEPRLSLRQSLGASLVAKAGVGLFHQEPDFGEDYPRFGNPALGPEKAWHYAVGAEWHPLAGLHLDATVFYKSLSNLVSPTDRTAVQDGVVTPLVYDNGGRGRVMGLEVLLRRELSATLTGWIAYTLSRSRRLDSGADTWRLFDFDQTHILTALGSYKLARNWTLGGRFRFVSGNPRTPVVGSVVNATADRYEPLFGAVNSARNPSFHQLDLRIDKRWVFDRWILTTYLDVQNVYNHRYAEGLSYSYDYSQSKPQSGLPILTIFGVRGEL